MSEISRVALFGKLNSLAYKAIEGATVFCKLRGNPYVELEHWLQQILADAGFRPASHHPALRARSVAAGEGHDRRARPPAARRDLDLRPVGAHRECGRAGWVYGSLMFGDTQVRTGHLVVGMLKTSSLRNALLDISRQFERIKLDTLTDEFADDRRRFARGQACAPRRLPRLAAPGEASGAMAPAQMGKQEALKRFAIDLTERARKGEIDPISGRDEEIRQIVDILMRRRQNNPILTGEAGVGKTAVVEGFARASRRATCRRRSRTCRCCTLDIGLLQAGASMKGEFENRLRQVIDEVQASPKPIILFIDEAHTLIGAGGAAGTGRCGQSAEAGAGARHAAHDRRDDVGRIQEVHREGSGADPALPGRAGGRAERGEGDPDGARRGLDAGEAPSRASARRSARGGGAAVASLHSRRGSCPTRRSACSTRRARASPSASTRRRPRSKTAAGASRRSKTELEIIGREEAVGIDVGARRTDAAEKARRTSAIGSRKLEERWAAEKTLVDRILELARKLRAGGKPVDKPGADR